MTIADNRRSILVSDFRSLPASASKWGQRQENPPEASQEAGPAGVRRNCSSKPAGQLLMVSWTRKDGDNDGSTDD